MYVFNILFHYRLLQGTEYSSLCYTISPCYTSILYRIVCICWSQVPNFSLLYLSPLVTLSLFSVSVSLFLMYLINWTYNQKPLTTNLPVKEPEHIKSQTEWCTITFLLRSLFHPPFSSFFLVHFFIHLTSTEHMNSLINSTSEFAQPVYLKKNRGLSTV